MNNQHQLSEEDNKCLEELHRTADTVLKKLDNPEVKRAMTTLLRRGINPRALSMFNDLLTVWNSENHTYPNPDGVDASEKLGKTAGLSPLPGPSKEPAPPAATAMETSSDPCLPKESESLEVKMERMERIDNTPEKDRKGKKRGPAKQWGNMMTDLGTAPLEDAEGKENVNTKQSYDVISITTSADSVYQSPLSSKNVSPWSSNCVDEMASTAFTLQQVRDVDYLQSSQSTSGYVDGSDSNCSKSGSVENDFVEPDPHVTHDIVKVFENFAISLGDELKSGSLKNVFVQPDSHVTHDIVKVFKNFAISLGDELNIEKNEPLLQKNEQEALTSSVGQNDTSAEIKKINSPVATSISSDESGVSYWPVMENTAEFYGLIPPRVHQQNLNLLNNFAKEKCLLNSSTTPSKRDYGNYIDSSNGQDSMWSKKRKLTYDHWIPDHVVSSIACTPQKVIWNEMMTETGTWPISPNFNNWNTNFIFKKPINPETSRKRKRPLSDNP